MRHLRTKGRVTLMAEFTQARRIRLLKMSGPAMSILIHLAETTNPQALLVSPTPHDPKKVRKAANLLINIMEEHFEVMETLS